MKFLNLIVIFCISIHNKYLGKKLRVTKNKIYVHAVKIHLYTSEIRNYMLIIIINIYRFIFF